MMVTFISQCEKKALNRTRRVLDLFANRIGDKTWQTVITNDGLNAVKKLLRKSASKNTAVSCYWFRSRSRSELIWIVGNRQKFNAQGLVPVSISKQATSNTYLENDWHYLPLIECLTALAALFHDLGKASRCFQEKLKPNSKKRFLGDPLRHEWVSTLLLNAFVNNETDDLWISRLAKGEINEETLKRVAAQNIDKPLAKLPPAASLLAWLIVTHHKLPIDYDDIDYRDEKAGSITELFEDITRKWGYQNSKDEGYEKRVSQCLEFPNGLPSQSKPWLTQIMKWATKMQQCMRLLNQAFEDNVWRIILHHSRLSLMLGDHHYSSKDADKSWQSDMTLIANTYRDNVNGHVKGAANQMLDEHLVGVSRAARAIVNLLPKFESEPPHAYDIRALKRKSPSAFKWQDLAVDKIKEWRSQVPKRQLNTVYGFFAVNMASTGCGKTYANAKVMRALSTNADSLRYILALGLRTLTLQTGDEYRDRIGLTNSELAVLIGSRAIMELHNESNVEQQRAQQEERQKNESAGSESLEELFDEEFIDFECAIPESRLNTILVHDRHRQFLYAPVLVCTIDHMMAATECLRGGRYILPCLRLMSSDLVIDEIDDFDESDLIAIGRLIHLAGMLGRKVMISSATIPPSLAEGYLNVYREGWLLYAKSRHVRVDIGCAWIDEFNTHVETLADISAKDAIAHYRDKHKDFTMQRAKILADQPIKRKAEIISCAQLKRQDGLPIQSNGLDNKSIIETEYFRLIQQAIIEKHLKNSNTDPLSLKTVSFGVVRVANILPCVNLAEYLATASWPQNIDIRVIAYHSQQVLLLRSELEKHLCQVLKRNEKQGEIPAPFKNPVIRSHIDNSPAEHIIFILVATPIEELGRDHDFDWAVVEPSSFRSIIQLAGRVLRHRNIVPSSKNIALMQYNLKALTNADGMPAYLQPGYERKSNNFKLKSHDLCQLIDRKILENGINAIPRILQKDWLELNPNDDLSDLEHFSISKLLTSYEKHGSDEMQGWLTSCWSLTALPQYFNSFRRSEEQIKLFLVIKNGDLKFIKKDDKGQPLDVSLRYGIEHKEISDAALSKQWLCFNYRQSIIEYADRQQMSEFDIALKYGELLLPVGDDGQQQYRYSYQLGLSKDKK